MHRTCVIDTSSLIYLTALNSFKVFDHLRIFTNQLHIPFRVKQEYEKGVGQDPTRQLIIQKLRINEGFFSYCTKYDSITLAILETTDGIDPGEAEAAAQQKFVQAEYIISDDKPFIDSLRTIDRYAKIINTLHLIAILRILGIPNTNGMLKKLRIVRPFSLADWRRAFIDVTKELGIAYSKKELDKHIRFDKTGL